MTTVMSARDVLGHLYRHFAQRYACLTELTVTESEPTGGRPYPLDRRCDLLLDDGSERILVEIKVSRADFLADVADPAKQAAWQRYTHRWAYAVPRGLVQPDEVPAGWGLLVVGEVPRDPERPWAPQPPVVEWARRAPKHVRKEGRRSVPTHVPDDLPDRINRTIMLRLSRAEAHAKGYGWDVHQDGEDPAALRAQVERLRRDVTLAENAAERARDRAREWHRRYTASNPPPCSTCAEPLRPARSRAARYTTAEWEHTPEQEAVCEPLRRAAYELVRPDYDQHLRYVPGPAPVDPLAEEPSSSAEPAA